MLEKVISGGQTGADQGGLFAASILGIETGGWAPKGYTTESGPNLELKSKYHVIEHESPNFRDRTFANVKDSDGTLRFAGDFSSAGEKCTFQAIQEYEKPYLDVYVKKPIDHEKVVEWLLEKDIRVLNIAGNRESTHPGIYKFTTDYLLKVFRHVPHVSFLDTLYLSLALNVSDQKTLDFVGIKETNEGRELSLKSFPKVQARISGKKLMILDSRGEKEISLMTFRGSYSDLRTLMHRQLDVTLDDIFDKTTMKFFSSL